LPDNWQNAPDQVQQVSLSNFSCIRADELPMAGFFTLCSLVLMRTFGWCGRRCRAKLWILH
jgi:hypothetical protein